MYSNPRTPQYDSEVDVLRVLFSDAQIEESAEDKPGVILDYDVAGNVVCLGRDDGGEK